MTRTSKYFYFGTWYQYDCRTGQVPLEYLIVSYGLHSWFASTTTTCLKKAQAKGSFLLSYGSSLLSVSTERVPVPYMAVASNVPVEDAFSRIGVVSKCFQDFASSTFVLEHWLPSILSSTVSCVSPSSSAGRERMPSCRKADKVERVLVCNINVPPAFCQSSLSFSRSSIRTLLKENVSCGRREILTKGPDGSVMSQMPSTDPFAALTALVGFRSAYSSTST